MAGTNRLRVAAITAALAFACAVALLVGGASALFTAGAHPAHAQTPPEDFVPGEVLVRFEPGASGQEIAEANRRNGGQVEQTIPGIGVRVVNVPVGRERSSVAAYERDPNVSYAEVNAIFRVTDHGFPNDDLVGEQWQYNNIDAFEAWHVTTGSDAVAIAILDTGIDQTHEDIDEDAEDLQGKIVKNRNFTKSNTVDDKFGHGTHVAGSAAALTDNDRGVAGTCPNCVLYNVKVLGDNGFGTASSVASGIKWAADNDAEVINMSLGGPSGSRTLKRAINNAWEKGVVLAAAAGNGGKKDPFYPAYYSNVIAVAATDRKDDKAEFSNYGGWVDVAAPGKSILSTAPDHPSRLWNRVVLYRTLSGTSMASPHVAGVAGLVWSTGLCDDLDTNDNGCVRDRVEGTAEAIRGTGRYWTNGRINAENAVTPPGG